MPGDSMAKIPVTPQFGRQQWLIMVIQKEGGGPSAAFSLTLSIPPRVESSSQTFFSHPVIGAGDVENVREKAADEKSGLKSADYTGKGVQVRQRPGDAVWSWS
jgi:hypothetical protein